MASPKRIYTYTDVTIERRLQTINDWILLNETLTVILDAALENPAALDSGILNRLVEGLTHSVNMMRLIKNLVDDADESNVELDLDVNSLWEGLKSSWIKMRKLSQCQLKIIKADPLKVKSQQILALIGISRRSLNVLQLLEAREAQEREEQELRESGGLSESDMQVMQEWQELEASMDLDEFKDIYDDDDHDDDRR